MYRLLKNKQTNKQKFKKLEAEEIIIICLMNEDMVMSRGLVAALAAENIKSGVPGVALASRKIHQLLISDNRPYPSKPKQDSYIFNLHFLNHM